jgi:hypothetical protein
VVVVEVHTGLFCQNNPVNNTDPSGNEIESMMVSFSINTILAQMPNLVTVGKALGKADTSVLLETHPVKLGHNHSYIVMMVNNGSRFFADSRFGNTAGAGGLHYATLGAGPKGVWLTLLVSDVNRPTDVAREARNYSATIRPPIGKTGDDFIQTLFDADAKYPDNLEYDIIPGAMGANTYNSNSYVSGLLRATLGAAPTQPPVATGWNRPVPSYLFR